MTKNLLKPLLLLLCLLSINSYALPILQADAFITGDNKATLEVDTGLIWMDFGVNNDRTYAEVVNSLSTDYLGWRLPTTKEVSHLWTGLFGDLPEWYYFGSFGTLNTSDHDDYFNQLAELMGTNGDSINTGNENDQWLVKNMSGVFESSPGAFGLAALWIPYDDIHTNQALYLDVVNNIDSSWYGTLLVKDAVAVPEPGSLTLLALGLLGLATRRLRRQS